MNSKDIGQGGKPESATTTERANNSQAHNPPPFIHPRRTRVDFDSDEELHFYYWLGDALEVGLITGWQYHVQTFQLSARTTIRVPAPIKKDIARKKKKFLLHPQQYTPDFVFGLSMDFMDRIGYKIKMYPPSHMLGRIIIVDVKGTYARAGNNSAITFPVLQKWLCDKQKIYVNKVVPAHLFRKTWCPKQVAFVRGGATRSKTWKDCMLLSEWKKQQVK